MSKWILGKKKKNHEVKRSHEENVSEVSQF